MLSYANVARDPGTVSLDSKSSLGIPKMNNADHIADLLDSAVLPARTFTVTVKGQEIAFQSSFMDNCAHDLIRYVPGRFARSLYECETPSPKQIAWIHKLAVDFARDCGRDGDNDNSPKFGALFAAFQAAIDKGAKRLKLRFNGFDVKPNRDLSVLWVTSQTETEEGQYGLKPKYLGKVTPSKADSRLPDNIREALIQAADDPLTAAIRYGRETGSCSCCGRELTDPRSIERGIGPVCASKFGW